LIGTNQSFVNVLSGWRLLAMNSATAPHTSEQLLLEKGQYFDELKKLFKRGTRRPSRELSILPFTKANRDDL
jgi:hypothetical protein